MISRLFLFILAFSFCQSVGAQIGAKIKEQEEICGMWSNSDFAFQMTLVLNRDGSGEFDGKALNYKVDGNRLIMTQSDNDVNYSFIVQSNSLRLSDGDLEDTVLFERNINQEVSDDLHKDVKRENLNLAQLKIGNQIWSAENLNVTRFRNGAPIQEAKTNQEWRLACKEGRPCWCYYNNDFLLGKKYGILYNWFAINDSRGLAPTGFHVPDNDEWMALANQLDGSMLIDPEIKNSSVWLEDNCGFQSFKKDNEINENVFAGPPGGYRNENGKFMAMGISSNWWSATEENRDNAWVSVFKNWDCNIKGNTGLKMCGASVRCVKD
ncbi:MAG: fibrobacter succinogenes major paralogous domain-containing protein [Saprospiraceae bacterium]